MKFLFALSATASVALAAVIPQQEPLAQTIPSIVQNSQTTRWLIELSPYQTRWVTEEEKWALKLVGLPRAYIPNKGSFLPSLANSG